MPVIRISKMPLGKNSNVFRDDLCSLITELKEKVANTKELKTTPENVSVLFPPDHMVENDTEELIIEIFSIDQRPEITKEVLTTLARVVKEIVSQFAKEKLLTVRAFLVVASTGTNVSA